LEKTLAVNLWFLEKQANGSSGLKPEGTRRVEIACWKGTVALQGPTRDHEHHEDLYEHMDRKVRPSVSRTRGIHATPAPRIGFHENAHVSHSCVTGAWGQFKGVQLLDCLGRCLFLKTLPDDRVLSDHWEGCGLWTISHWEGRGGLTIFHYWRKRRHTTKGGST
jgi:hypothetical protein